VKGGLVRDPIFMGGYEHFSGFEGSQAEPARPSGKGRLERRYVLSQGVSL
jgi:hypothetical protein